MSTNKDDYLVKILLVGESGVGKSCLILRFVEDSFTDSFISTIGVDFKFKTVKLPSDDKMVRMQIWDTAGQERFRTITHNYYRGAAGILLCYSVTDQKSFAQVNDWMEDIKKYAHASISVVVVGTKVDMEEKRVIDFEKANQFAKSLGLRYVESSSKDGRGVEEAFMALVEEIMKRRGVQEKEKGGVNLNKAPANNGGGGGCC